MLLFEADALGFTKLGRNVKDKYKKFATESDALAFILKNSTTGRAGICIVKSEIFSPLASPKQNMWEGVPVVYTDGACSSNGRAGAAAGIGVYWGEQHVDNISEPLSNGSPTNNRAELTAVIRAVQTAIQRGYLRLIVRTDSKLLIQTMNSWIHRWRKNGWKTSNGTAVKNQDLIIELSGLLENINVFILRPNHKIKLRYVSSTSLDMQEYLETKKQMNWPEKEQLATVKSFKNVKEVKRNIDLLWTLLLCNVGVPCNYERTSVDHKMLRRFLELSDT
ncbi:unnamed protein product [Litomosoides sigmodontis]|uniref:ribonuclease H n=1 Tax=Litomosoides sigmodontis TaxID=42156 RepID=A0A3P7KDS2_LITSI|nr:unnamed protein product [Litomosoides sigmodontis]